MRFDVLLRSLKVMPTIGMMTGTINYNISSKRGVITYREIVVHFVIPNQTSKNGIRNCRINSAKHKCIGIGSNPFQRSFEREMNDRPGVMYNKVTTVTICNR